jgi:hypothetical protein
MALNTASENYFDPELTPQCLPRGAGWSGLPRQNKPSTAQTKGRARNSPTRIIILVIPDLGELWCIKRLH